MLPGERDVLAAEIEELKSSADELGRRLSPPVGEVTQNFARGRAFRAHSLSAVPAGINTSACSRTLRSLFCHSARVCAANVGVGELGTTGIPLKAVVGAPAQVFD